MYSNDGWKKPSNWYSEIRKKSRPEYYYARIVAALLIFVIILSVPIINIICPSPTTSGQSPTTCQIGAITIDQATKNILSVTAAIIASLFAVGWLPSFDKWLKKPSIKYRAASYEIIEELKKKDLIESADEEKLKNIASKHLSGLEVGTVSDDDADDRLISASDELAHAITN